MRPESLRRAHLLWKVRWPKRGRGADERRPKGRTALLPGRLAGVWRLHKARHQVLLCYWRPRRSRGHEIPSALAELLAQSWRRTGCIGAPPSRLMRRITPDKGYRNTCRIDLVS